MFTLANKTSFCGAICGLIILGDPHTATAHGVTLVTEPTAVSSPAIIQYESYYTVQQPLLPNSSIVEPFLGSSVDIRPYVQTLDKMPEPQTHPHGYDERVDYQWQIGANVAVGKSLALNVDPVTGKFNTELSLGSSTGKTLAPRFRLRLRTQEVKLMMNIKF